MSEPVVKYTDVSFAYNSDYALKDVCLDIYEKEFIWVVGPNGGGKTTLVKLMLGLLKPRIGKIQIFGVAPEQARDKVGYMPQSVNFDPLFPATVLDVTLMGRLDGGRFLGFYNHEDRLAAGEALEMAGLSGFEKKPFSSLSGGQQRRLLIARALAGRPKLLILDEPTANLDLRVEKELNDVLLKLKEILTIIVVSHDPAFVAESVEKVFCVNKTVAEHPTSAISADFLGHFYGGEVRMVRHDKNLEE